MSRLTILISGAGIAGPTLAYWLRRGGFTPVLVERAPAFRSGGYMIDFWGLGMEVAERMDLLPQVRERGYRIEQMRFVAADGEVRSVLDAGIFARILGDRFTSLPRGDLAEAIWTKAAREVEVIYDESISAIEPRPDGVEVTLKNSGTRRFDLVAGCDGLHSVVREIVFGPEEGFEKYLGYATAAFTTEGYPQRDEGTYLTYGAPGRQISRYALRGGRTAFFFVFARETPPAKEENPRQLLRKMFAGEKWIEMPEIMRRLDRCDDLYFDAVSQIHLPAWSRGRCVLLGDAAYCPSLLAGEGASFAMAGAYLLAGELAQADGDFVGAFARYEKKLRPFLEAKQRSAAQFAHSFAPRTRLGLFLRDQVLHLAEHFGPVADYLARRFVRDDFALPRYEF